MKIIDSDLLSSNENNWKTYGGGYEGIFNTINNQVQNSVAVLSEKTIKVTSPFDTTIHKTERTANQKFVEWIK